MKKIFTAPLISAMQNYSNDGALAFHIPGHKQGLGAHELLKNLITAERAISARRLKFDF